ncbi:MAG: hypothetical protein R3307_02760 [Anaerolineales bacterium]|nr:hypothetical protein [Anaerolineales bacterium]
MEMQQALPSLRPLKLGELLDQAIRLYRRNFLTFIGIIAVVYVPITILQTASSALLSSSILDFTPSAPEEIFSRSSYWIGMLSTLLLAFLQIFLVQGIATGALAHAVGNSYLGKKTGILEAYRGIGKSLLSLLGALLLLGLFSIAAFLWWVIIPCLGWFTGLGMIVFLAGAIAPLTAPAVVLEGNGAFEGVRRAWSLARRRFWPLLGYILVLYLFSLLIVNGPAGIVGAVLTGAAGSGSFSDPNTYFMVTTIIQARVSLVATLIYYPLQMTAFTLIYFDLRVRTEGFDIAIQTMEPNSETDEEQLMPAPPPQTGERLITWPEIGNFAILTLGAVGIYIIFFSVLMGSVFFFSSLF